MRPDQRGFLLPLPALMHDPCALAQRYRRRGPTGHGCPVGRFSYFEVIHASNVLDDAGAGLVPDVHTEGEVRLGLHGQARLDSPWPAGIYTRMLLRSVPRPNGFIEPCLTSSAPKPPAGAGWIHEIKLDGFRLLARRDAVGVRLLTRRYPTIAAGVAALACRSCLIDGEVVICGEDGVPVFDRLRYGRRPQVEAMLFVFDLLELAGKDLRRTPVEERKRVLAKLLRKSSWALQLNEHIVESGDIVFRHACKLGFEGIVSKRLGSPYISGRSRHWIKSKHPAAPAVKREAEKDWGP
jgi:bifunctional non-homologous end joining protein LigD